MPRSMCAVSEAFHHKGALTGAQVIRGSDAGKIWSTRPMVALLLGQNFPFERVS